MEQAGRIARRKGGVAFRRQRQQRMAAHAEGTFWYVLPSLPMFLLIPVLLRRGVAFWPALALGCALTIALYFAMTWIGPRFGLKL